MPETKTPRNLRRLLLPILSFAIGIAFTQFLQFTTPLLNYLFVAAILPLPFLAIRPLLRFSRMGKVIGSVFLIPVLLADLLFGVWFLLVLTLSPSVELHHYRTDSCIHELAKIDEKRYSVHLLRDCGGGAPVSFTVWIEQRMPLLPGLYVVREIDSFYGAYEGTLSIVDRNSVRLQIPVGIEGSGWMEAIDRTYQLKRYVYLY